MRAEWILRRDCHPQPTHISESRRIAHGDKPEPDNRRTSALVNDLVDLARLKSAVDGQVTNIRDKTPVVDAPKPPRLRSISVSGPSGSSRTVSVAEELSKLAAGTGLCPRSHSGMYGVTALS